MKKSRFCFLIIFVLAVSCTKSRFATTTRNYHDGKVSYTNHYSNERMKLNRHKTKPPATLTQGGSVKTTRNPKDNPETINKMNLIASSDKNFLILNNMERLISQYPTSLFPESHNEKALSQSKHPSDTLTKDHATASVKKISQGDSTTVEKRDNSKGNTAGTGKTDNRKTEKLGLAGFILSFFGIIPLIGIPFAVLAIIFGATSLKRIKRNPEKYKGKGFAIASIVMGCAMIVMNIIIMATSIHAAAKTSTPTINTSSTKCRF